MNMDQTWYSCLVHVGLHFKGVLVWAPKLEPVPRQRVQLLCWVLLRFFYACANGIDDEICSLFFRDVVVNNEGHRPHAWWLLFTRFEAGALLQSAKATHQHCSKSHFGLWIWARSRYGSTRCFAATMHHLKQCHCERWSVRKFLMVGYMYCSTSWATSEKVLCFSQFFRYRHMLIHCNVWELNARSRIVLLSVGIVRNLLPTVVKREPGRDLQ